MYCSHHGKAFSFINIPLSCICYSFPQVCFVSLILCDLNEWPEWDILNVLNFLSIVWSTWSWIEFVNHVAERAKLS